MSTTRQPPPEITEALNPIVDADAFLYSCGFIDVVRHPDGTVEAPPLRNTLQTLRKAMEAVMEKFPKRSWEKVYIGGEGNFRYEVAKQKPYKGSRVNQPKPPYMLEMKEYLVDQWGAERVDGRESDDAVGELQWSHPDKSTCIVGVDKDLITIPGHHYNPSKKEFRYVTLREADCFFWTQMLTGDPSDNIPGVPKVGPKTVEKLFSVCKNDTVAMRKAVETEYKRFYKDQWRSVMDEMATLLFIHREPGKSWRDYHMKGAT